MLHYGFSMSLANSPIWTVAHLAIKFPAATVLAVGTYFGVAYLEQSPTVVITFDDGRASIADVALPYLQNQGLVATNYLNTDLFGVDGYVDASTVATFAAAGWEIGSHGVSHDDLTTTTAAQLDLSLRQSKAVLSMLSGQPITSFASPYGSFNDDTIASIQQVYSNHVGAVNGWNDQHGVNDAQTDPYTINRIDITDDVSAAAVCARVAMLEDDQVYVVLFHNITNEPGKYNTPVDKFEQIVDCLVEADVNMTTITEAVEAMRSK